MNVRKHWHPTNRFRHLQEMTTWNWSPKCQLKSAQAHRNNRKQWNHQPPRTRTSPLKIYQTAQRDSLVDFILSLVDLNLVDFWSGRFWLGWVASSAHPGHNSSGQPYRPTSSPWWVCKSCSGWRHPSCSAMWCQRKHEGGILFAFFGITLHFWHHIALNKKGGGLRPIAIGLCLRRLASKVVNRCVYNWIAQHSSTTSVGSWWSWVHAAHAIVALASPFHALVKLGF